ncbi:MAG: HAMP domain-containing sensor histidine kinase [Pseudomonadota bacterium]
MSDPSADKIIVERLSGRGDDQSRQAVKDLREGLGLRQRGTFGRHDHFGMDALRRHAQMQYRSRITLLIIVTLGGYLAHFALPIETVAIWLTLAFGGIGVLLRTARVFLDSDAEQKDAVLWERRFMMLQIALGIIWGLLFFLHPIVGQDGVFSVLVFSGAMVLMGSFVIISPNLKYGAMLAAFPIVAVTVSRLAMTGTIAALGMALVLAGACFFFQRVGDLTRNAYIDFLGSKAERDQLIMELEASRSISDEARRRAEESNLAKSRFLATMSHELRTPLNAILGFSEVMSKEVMGPLNNDFYKEYVGDIHSSGSHLLQLINEILDLSRVEAGRYELNEEATSLTDCIDASQQMVKLKASEKEIALVVQVHPGLPQIWADERAVRQIVLNLLSNAIKFTPRGGTIWLKCGWTAGGGQYVSIKDTGPGISEEEIPIVLSSFGQGSIAIKSAEQGTGLGLPIVQALMHMHDGHFELKSKLREGTEVIATFPRSRVMEIMPAVPTDGEEKASEESSFRLRRRRVQAPPLANVEEPHEHAQFSKAGGERA